MLANHTYVGSNGKQNSMFPLETMYISQGELNPYSHAGSYAMDFLGMANASTRIYRCPYYAPVDLELVARPDDENHVYVYTSLSEVNFVDGTTGYLTIMFNHDNSIYNIGRRVAQGYEIGKTGTFGNNSSTGVADHVHIEVKKGQWEGLIQNSQGTWVMKNATHIYSLLGINDTLLLVNGGYNWQYFGGSPTPVPPLTTSRRKFPWVLYARKLRESRR